ncbi:MAG TPA: GTP cyclohydrolase MptA [Candidatus Binatus sp.]|nr:GTP cyclohydrolase MptA [Candidatus Binatus sp.]
MPESGHFIALGLGSNLGDREANLSRALALLREVIHIDRISPVYETRPVGFEEQPEFLNCACIGRTALLPHELQAAVRSIERSVGRTVSFPMGPRAIDIDILIYDDLVMNEDDLTLPHPRMRERGFVLVPLRDVAPQLVEPVSGRTIAQLAAAIDLSGIRKCERSLVTRIQRDVQEMRPQVPLALNRAGVTGVKTTLSLPLPAGRQSVIATLDIFADLDAAHSGVHMSRFSQDLEDALFELARQAEGGLESLALAVAKRVVESQRAEIAHVDVRAEFALWRHTPASGIPTNEFYTALARAVVAPDFARSLSGVEAEGITACPCARSMVAETARERLAAAGFTPEQVDTVLSTVPIATHNQRGRGTLLVGGAGSLTLPTMVAIVEQSMSSETYDLLKRPDELFVVNKAHSAPRFVEDVVREMLRYANDALADSPDDAFVFARQLNYESIHKHDAVAESCALLGELRRELAGETGVSHTSLEEWMYGRNVAAGT